MCFTNHSFAVFTVRRANECVFHKVVFENLSERSVSTQEIVHHLISADNTIPVIQTADSPLKLQLNKQWLHM